MALIRCPECSTEVSDRAAACPKCACPLQAAAPPVVGQVTVEKTSKRLKTHYLLGLGTTVVGLIAVASAGADGPRGWGALLFFGGLAWLVVTKVRRWWQHD